MWGLGKNSQNPWNPDGVVDETLSCIIHLQTTGNDNIHYVNFFQIRVWEFPRFFNTG